MLNYIIRRLAQAIPQLFLISIVLFMLMQAFGDPIASLGVRTPPRPADRERLRRQLGLDQPLYIQYLSWLIGNDWIHTLPGPRSVAKNKPSPPNKVFLIPPTN